MGPSEYALAGSQAIRELCRCQFTGEGEETGEQLNGFRVMWVWGFYELSKLTSQSYPPKQLCNRRRLLPHWSRNSSMDLHDGNWPVPLFSTNDLIWFWNQGHWVFIKPHGEEFVWVNIGLSLVRPIWAWSVLEGKVLNSSLNSLNIYRITHVYYFFWGQLWCDGVL